MEAYCILSVLFLEKVQGMNKISLGFAIALLTRSVVITTFSNTFGD
jgi:hypothetical protein